MVENVKIPPLTEAPTTVVGGTPTATFPFDFPFFDPTDIVVFVDDVALSQSAFTVTGYALQDGQPVLGGFGSGLVTLDVPVSDCTVTVDRDVAADRETQFSRSAPLGMPALNGDLNRLTARQQDIKRRVLRDRSYLEDAIEAAGASIGLIGKADKASNGADFADPGAVLDNLTVTLSGDSAIPRPGGEKLRDFVNLLDYIPAGQRAAIRAGTSTYDATDALKAALDENPGKEVRLPPGRINLGNVGGLEFAGTRIVGDSRYETTVKPIAGMTAGTAIFYNRDAAVGSSAYTYIGNIRFRFEGANVIGVDLSSVNNSIVEACYFAGTEAGASQVGVGVRFGSPLDQASYSNNVRDCAFYSLAKGVEYLINANSNMITGGECIYCAIGVDAAPVGYLDTPRIIGMRFEGGGIGIKEKSEGANYLACRFESNSTADIDFIDNGGGDQSRRPLVLGGYTATTVTSLRNLGNAVSPMILSPDMARYDIENSTTPKQSHGRHVFAARTTAVNPTRPHPSVEYAGFFFDTLAIRNAISLEWTNAANTNTVIAVSVDSANRTVIRSYDRATATDDDVIVGAGPAVRALSNAATDLGTGAVRYKDGYFSGNIYSLTGVISLESDSGVIYMGAAGDIVLRRPKTGWAQATGTATRSTFDTASVTLEQLAQRVKALIDDLHISGGHHGLLKP